MLPGAGLVWVLRSRQRLKRTVVGACVVGSSLVLAGLGAGAWRQSTTWRDTETLWRHAISVDPANARAHYYLGYWLYVTEREEEARAEYERARALTESEDMKAKSLGGIAASWTRQGIATARRGEIQRAVGMFVRAVRAVPGYPGACRSLRKLAAATRIEPDDLATCPDAAAGDGDAD